MTFLSLLKIIRFRAELTAHLHALQVPQVLHSHLQDVCFFQLGVSGALREMIASVKSRNFGTALKERSDWSCLLFNVHLS